MYVPCGINCCGHDKKTSCLRPYIWDADFLKEYIIIFKKNDVLWTATQLEL